MARRTQVRGTCPDCGRTVAGGIRGGRGWDAGMIQLRRHKRQPGDADWCPGSRKLIRTGANG